VRWLVAIVFGCAGCWPAVALEVVAAQQKHERARQNELVTGGVEYGEWMYGPLGPLTADLAVDESRVIVTAVRPRGCTRPRVAFTMTRGGTRDSTPIDPIRVWCSLPAADVHVVVSLPSGATLEGVTGQDGQAMFTMPNGQPEHGSVSAEVEGLRVTKSYYPSPAVCDRERYESFVRVSSASTPAERVGALRAIPLSCGVARDRTWSQAVTAVLEAAASNCDATATAELLLGPDYDVHAAFVHEPDVVACFQSAAAHKAARATERAECVRQRSEQMLRAQGNADIAERTRALTNLPDCGPRER